MRKWARMLVNTGKAFVDPFAIDDPPPSSKKNRQAKAHKLKFDLEKLKDLNVLETFQAIIGRTFVPLTIMNCEDTDMDTMITTFNTAVTETASEILCKHRQKKKKKKTGSLQKFLICATKAEN